MREILFRGRSVDTDEWVYGSFCMDALEQVGHPIEVNGFIRWYDIENKKVLVCEVERETVGQYTGLCDKNGKKIFEGDVLSHYINWLGRRVNGVCEYDDKEQAAWMCRFVDESENEATGFLADWVDNNGCEIIGNIHDNPELLKGGAQE